MPTDMAAERPGARSDRTPRRRARKLTASERTAALGLVLLVFLAVLAFGASEVTTATLFAGFYAAFLSILLVTCDWARRDLGRIGGLPLQAALFALLIAAVLWPLSPLGPGGPHPAWSYVQGDRGSLTIDRSALLLNVLQLLGLACLYLSARIIGASEARGLWLLKAGIAVLGLYASAALISHVGVRRSERLAATLLSPNSAATTFGAGAMLAVALVTNRLRRTAGLTVLRRADPEAVTWLGVVALLVTVLVLTASRGGVAASLVGLGCLLLWNLFAQRHTAKGAAGLVGMVAILVVATIALRSLDPLTDRFNRAGQDMDIRATIFSPHWQAFLTSPWSGFGLGSFPTVNQLIVTQGSLRVLFEVRAAHNLYLQWLEEAGVIGAAAMLAVFASLIWPILRGGAKDSAVGACARAVVCAAIVFLVHGMTDFALQVPAIQALCVMILGVVGSLTMIRASGRDAPSNRRTWRVGLMAGGVIVATVLAGAPLVAAKLNRDLSAWPTAPTEAVASAIESELALPNAGPETLTHLEALSARELALSPASGAAWLRCAAIEARLGHEDASNSALERSFAMAPLQASLFDQRTIFAYEHWGQLSPSARDQTIYHFKAEWRRTGRQARFVAMANNLRNPAGRIGMALQIALLRMSPQS